ncbi:hypothetical protein [Polaromonas hydrogenivorans]|uniref:Uncharacterized protein n=1 Tax=Polaromonas hydrogenivorans TaxID=335476 RepID=A0AAU7LY41_9BURK
MENDIRLRYGSARPGVLEDTPIMVLHICEEQTAVATEDGSEPHSVLVRFIGSRRTAVDFFKHTPCLPGKYRSCHDGG